MTASWFCTDLLRVLFCDFMENQYPTRKNTKKELHQKEVQVFLHRHFCSQHISSLTSHLSVYVREKAEEVKYYCVRPQIRKELSVKIFSAFFLGIALCCRIS